jgi:hypothetical protein
VKIRMDRNVFLRTNTIAFLPVMKKNVLKLADNVIKLITLSLMKKPNKLECFSLGTHSSLV